MTEDEKEIAVKAGIEQFGWNFFMVDCSSTTIKACPFHIENEKDRFVFVRFASKHIKWEVKKYA